MFDTSSSLYKDARTKLDQAECHLYVDVMPNLPERYRDEVNDNIQFWDEESGNSYDSLKAAAKEYHAEDNNIVQHPEEQPSNGSGTGWGKMPSMPEIPDILHNKMTSSSKNGDQIITEQNVYNDLTSFDDPRLTRREAVTVSNAVLSHQKVERTGEYELSGSFGSSRGTFSSSHEQHKPVGVENSITVQPDGVVFTQWGKAWANYQVSPREAMTLLDVLGRDANCAPNEPTLMDKMPSNSLVDLVGNLYGTGGSKKITPDEFNERISGIDRAAMGMYEITSGAKEASMPGHLPDQMVKKVTQPITSIPDTETPISTGIKP